MLGNSHTTQLHGISYLAGYTGILSSYSIIMHEHWTPLK